MIDRGGVNRFDGINLIDGWFSLRGTSVHVVQSCWLEAKANFFTDAWTTHGRGGATNGTREDGTQHTATVEDFFRVLQLEASPL